jgi:hypothetical protein
MLTLLSTSVKTSYVGKTCVWLSHLLYLTDIICLNFTPYHINIVKIRCLLYLFLFVSNILKYKIRHGVTSEFIFPTNQSAISLQFITEYTPWAVVRFVLLFNCLTYDWMVKNELKIIWHHLKRDVVCCWLFNHVFGVELRVMLFPEPYFISHETKIRLFIFWHGKSVFFLHNLPNISG